MGKNSILNVWLTWSILWIYLFLKIRNIIVYQYHSFLFCGFTYTIFKIKISDDSSDHKKTEKRFPDIDWAENLKVCCMPYQL